MKTLTLIFVLVSSVCFAQTYQTEYRYTSKGNMQVKQLSVDTIQSIITSNKTIVYNNMKLEWFQEQYSGTVWTYTNNGWITEEKTGLMWFCKWIPYVITDSYNSLVNN